MSRLERTDAMVSTTIISSLPHEPTFTLPLTLRPPPGRLSVVFEAPGTKVAADASSAPLSVCVGDIEHQSII